MMPLSYDFESPPFAQRIHERIASAFRDECMQIHHEAEETYCRCANARVGPEADARYEYAKRALQVSRGMLAEAQDTVNTYRNNI